MDLKDVGANGTHEIVPDFELIPNGEYQVEIFSGEMEEATNRKCDKKFWRLKLKMELLEGTYAGRTITSYFALRAVAETHDEIEKQVKRGLSNLQKLGNAVGLSTLPDSYMEFLGRKLTAKIITIKGKNGFQDSNMIADYLPPKNEVAATSAGGVVDVSFDDDDIPF